MYNNTDKLKALALILVVFAHTNSPFSGFVFSFHMPIVLTISGFLAAKSISKQTSIVAQFRKGTLKYLVYLFVFLALSVIATQAKNVVLNRDSIGFAEVLYYFLHPQPSNANGYHFVLWYFFALIWSYSLLVILVSLVRTRRTELFVSVILLISGLGGLYSFDSFYFGLDIALVSIPYYFLGVLFYESLLFRRVRARLLAVSRYSLRSSIILIFLFFMLYTAYGDFHSYLHLDIGNVKSDYPLVSLIWCCFLFGILVYFSSGLIGQGSVLEVFSRGSIIVFTTHPYTNNFAYVALESLSVDIMFLHGLVSIFCIYVFAYFITSLHKRVSSS
ncbi:MAG: acyltransferase [Oceanospirillaceae bacterium]|nr:acyltransferase [Oceanospirillaceae bacterium]